MDLTNKILDIISSLKAGNGENNEPIYFIGIGGIGMSALAKYFHSLGAVVAGYDKTTTDLTEEMEDMGITIHYKENLQAIPKDAALVIYTPAVPKEHAELVFYQKGNYLIAKRSDVLGAITNSSFNICVAGTHGKTTTSTMIAHVLRHSGYGSNAFLGGISANYKTNFWSSEKNVSVAEADEYDRSFLKLNPDIAVITAMDPDHLDIYGTAETMEMAFMDFSKKIKDGGLLITKKGLKREDGFTNGNHYTYSLNDTNADAYAQDVKMETGSYRFNVQLPGKTISDVVLNMGGMHNIENAVAAITVANHVGIDEQKIRDAVNDFKGVRRRFEYVIKSDRIVMIDDYAHHPEELRALIVSAKDLFKELKCTVVFQPHLYSRTHDLADGFAETLDLADEVILLPIYPARELPVPGVESKLISDRMKNKAVKILSKSELKMWAERYTDGLLVMAGAGDIDTQVDVVKQIIEKNKNH